MNDFDANVEQRIRNNFESNLQKIALYVVQTIYLDVDDGFVIVIHGKYEKLSDALSKACEIESVTKFHADEML